MNENSEIGYKFRTKIPKPVKDEGTLLGHLSVKWRSSLPLGMKISQTGSLPKFLAILR